VQWGCGSNVSQARCAAACRFMESMFTDEGKDERGELSPEALFWIYRNLGVGLDDADAKRLVARTDADAHGQVAPPTRLRGCCRPRQGCRVVTPSQRACVRACMCCNARARVGGRVGAFSARSGDVGGLCGPSVGAVAGAVPRQALRRRKRREPLVRAQKGFVLGQTRALTLGKPTR